MFQVQGLESHHSGVCEQQFVKAQTITIIEVAGSQACEQQFCEEKTAIEATQSGRKCTPTATVVYDTKTIIEFYIHFQNIYDYFIMSFFDYSLSSFFYDFSQCNKRSSSKLIQLVPLKIQCFHSIIIWHLIIQLHTQVLLFAKYFINSSKELIDFVVENC